MKSYTLSTSVYLKRLEQCVRHASKPSSPNIIQQYISVKSERAETLSDEKKRVVYLQMFQLLLDTMCDCALPYHWRCSCLDNIYRPLALLKQLSNSERDEKKLRKLAYELSCLSHYFLTNSPDYDVLNHKYSVLTLLNFSSNAGRRPSHSQSYLSVG